jgi:Mce-associated membrane protein
VTDTTQSETARPVRAVRERKPEPPEPIEAKRRRRWWPIALAGVLAALLLASVVGLVRAGQLRDDPAAANKALTDTEGTSNLIGDVSTTLSKVFSYTPDNTQVTADDAKDLLGGRAATQYNELFGQVKSRVAEQKLTLTTHVVRAGVIRLDGKSAKLHVFLDQTAERKGKKPTNAAAQLSITAELRGGHWRITAMKSR